MIHAISTPLEDGKRYKLEVRYQADAHQISSHIEVPHFDSLDWFQLGSSLSFLASWIYFLLREGELLANSEWPTKNGPITPSHTLDFEWQ